MNEPTDAQHVIEMKGISKRFPGVVALDKVDFALRPGEVHILLGENGAGKSTLIKVLSGAYIAEEGEVFINGQPVVIKSPQDPLDHGLRFIYQELNLVRTLDIARNLFLGMEPMHGAGLVDSKSLYAKATELLKRFHIELDPTEVVGKLSVTQQKMVEIARALTTKAQVIVLDEPTAVLTPQEVCDLFVTLKRMVSEGHALVFISHKMHEVMEISTRVSVLRDGYLIGSRPAAGATRDELVAMMVGRDVKPLSPQPQNTGTALLKVTGLHAIGDRGTEALAGVDLELRGGEILGLAGVSGNGQRELCQCLAGLRPVTAGTIIIDGKDMTHASLHDRMEAGQAYIPEERMRDGAIREFSVEENIFLHEHNSPKYTRAGVFLDFAKMAVHAQKLVTQYAVKTPGLKTPIKNLSGGNIQKVIMARELSRNPKILIAAQPTRGVDIGASEYIHQRLLEQRAAGMGILLISEDLDETRELSDRIAVIYEGKIMGIVNRGEATVEEIGLMMAGESMDKAVGREPCP